MNPNTLRLLGRIAVKRKIEAELLAITARSQASQFEKNRESLSGYADRLQSAKSEVMTGRELADIARFTNASLAAARTTTFQAQQAAMREQAALQTWAAAHEQTKSINTATARERQMVEIKLDRIATHQGRTKPGRKSLFR